MTKISFNKRQEYRLTPRVNLHSKHTVRMSASKNDQNERQGDHIYKSFKSQN